MTRQAPNRKSMFFHTSISPSNFFTNIDIQLGAFRDINDDKWPIYAKTLFLRLEKSWTERIHSSIYTTWKYSSAATESQRRRLDHCRSTALVSHGGKQLSFKWPHSTSVEKLLWVSLNIRNTILSRSWRMHCPHTVVSWQPPIKPYASL